MQHIPIERFNISFVCRSQFLDEIREVMGIPEWFLTVDSRKTNILYNGACVQLYVHFKGPLITTIQKIVGKLKKNIHVILHV